MNQPETTPWCHNGTKNEPISSKPYYRLRQVRSAYVRLGQVKILKSFYAPRPEFLCPQTFAKLCNPVQPYARVFGEKGLFIFRLALAISNPRNRRFQTLLAKAKPKPNRFKPMQGKKSSSFQNRFSTGILWYLEFLWSLDVGVWTFPSCSPPLTCLPLSLIFM
jgi:hypothetical protein